MFVMLVFSGQGTVYLVRERHHFWHSMPGRWILLSSAVDLVAVSLMANQGILMAPLPLNLIVLTFGAILLYTSFVDFLKIRIFIHLRVH
jgi:H+-transporting ATPase